MLPENITAIVARNEITSPGSVWDATSARLAQHAGFEYGLMGGSIASHVDVDRTRDLLVAGSNLTRYGEAIAEKTGTYGLYAFNTIGGRILNSEAYYVNDGAFYIGQTPPQDKPVQTLVRNIDAWGSPIGFSATYA